MKKYLKAITVFSLLLFTITLQSQSLFWQSISDMPDVRRNHSCVYLDGNVYVLGGYNSSTSKMNTNFVYDTLSESWTSKAPMNQSRSNLGVVALNNKIYAIGGDPFLNSIEEYNPDSNLWTEKTSMPTGRQHLGCAVVNNRIYAIGGLKTGLVYSRANEVYNPDSNSWESKAPLIADRELFGIAALDSIIYIFGGTDGPNVFKTTLCYNTNTDTWTTKANMPTARFGLATAVIDDKIYVIGGGGLNNNSLSSVDVYNPKTDIWETATNMQVARKLTASTAINGKVFVAGGANNSFVPYKSVEIGTVSLVGIDENNQNNEMKSFNVYNIGQTLYTDFTIEKQMKISVLIYDARGQIALHLQDRICSKGTNHIETNINLNTGMYFLVLQTKNEHYVKKFILF